MAVIPYVIDVNTRTVKVVRWPAMANGDVGQGYPMASWYADKTVEVAGTFGTGGKAEVQGTNQFTDPTAKSEPATGAYRPLEDPALALLDIITTDHQLKHVLSNPYWVRPAIIAGDGTTALSVILCMKKS